MANKSTAELKSDLTTIFTDGGLNTASEFRSFMTDMLDSVTQTVNIVVDSSLASLPAGSTILEHNLNATVYMAWIDISGVKYLLDITIIDDDNFSISWGGSTQTSPEIHIQFKY